MELIKNIDKLRSNRWSFSKSTVKERQALLLKLKDKIVERRLDIAKALDQDFRKPAKEAELTEIHVVIDEINYVLKNLAKWMRPTSVKTPIALLGSRSKIHYEARGLSLIMSPWNYPFYLVLSPLVSAISAGCVCVLRPSEKAPATSLIIKEIVNDVFSENIVYVALGGVDVSKELLEISFDHIFFTGSTRIGKIVMEKASKYLSSVTLELGGKSPVIIDEGYDLLDAVKKIVWGKYLNAGQTCVAPDYLFVPENKKNEICSLIKKQIEANFGVSESSRFQSLDFARLIDQVSYDRLIPLMNNEKKLISGECIREERFISPTVLFDITKDSPIMSEEIFGPILPIMTYKNLDEVTNFIKETGKPLALYLFSNNEKNINKILQETSSGGVLINHVLLHLANSGLPFGGVGASGMGGSHGHFGFLEFTHKRSVMTQGKWTLTHLYFPPYGRKISDIAFKFLKFLE
jgi:aldehyde dehydrogenase (NAD+)